MEYNDYFRDEYKYFLNSVVYNISENFSDDSDNGVNVAISDSLRFDANKDFLVIIATRKVDTVPETISTEVSYGARLYFKDISINVENVDWKEKFRTEHLFDNVLRELFSRISLIISQLTSACGQVPLITVPFIEKDI